MFWLVFVPIVLFIFLLIYILISTMRTSAHSTVRRPKEKRKPKQKPKKEPKKPKAKKKAKAEKPKPEPVKETPNRQEPATAPISQLSVTEEPAEVAAAQQKPEASAEIPFITLDESFEAERVVESVTEPAPVVEETSPVTEELPVREEVPRETAVEVPLEAIAEPQPVTEEEAYDYAPFDNARTMEEFGLSKEEANDFIVDMIQQIESELPGLEEAVSANDSKQIEEISHMLKGSATNLGTGGVADVLVDFNTYMKTSSDPDEIAKHMRNFRRALKELKEQFQS